MSLHKPPTMTHARLDANRQKAQKSNGLQTEREKSWPQLETMSRKTKGLSVESHDPSKMYLIEMKRLSLKLSVEGKEKKVPPWNSWVRRDRSKGVAHPAPNLLRDMWTNTNPEHRG
ncbi:MAG: hypothetical protein ABSF45_04840, partial [Terriglobia bacterium]